MNHTVIIWLSCFYMVIRLSYDSVWYSNYMAIIWLVYLYGYLVGALEHFSFSPYIGNHHPKRGWNHQPVIIGLSYGYCMVSIWLLSLLPLRSIDYHHWKNIIRLPNSNIIQEWRSGPVGSFSIGPSQNIAKLKNP